MNAPDRPVWFVGDLDDPWVEAIADAVPEVATRLSCAGELPEVLFPSLPTLRGLILQRSILHVRDAERLAWVRKVTSPMPRIVLCVGPHVRYADLERWSALVDVIVPEATARDTIARQVAGDGGPRPAGPRPRVSLVSRLYELRQVLADTCEAAGYPVAAAAGWSPATHEGLAVWDVPVLEPGWSRTLARRSRFGPVVTLLGFADRRVVRLARAQGAAACLDLPCDPADLVWVLDRLAATGRTEPPHDVPPPPHLGQPPRWPTRAARPTMERQNGRSRG